MKTHELKTWPVPFSAVWSEAKRYEIRKQDRDFSPGDRLHLREWDPMEERYTGDQVLCDVTYMTKGGDWGLPEELCVLSIRVLSWFPVSDRATGEREGT